MGHLLIIILLIICGNGVITEYWEDNYNTYNNTTSEYNNCEMAGKLELVKALVSEHGNNTILQDLVSVADVDINIIVLCCSDVLSVIRVTHNNSSFIIKQFNDTATEANQSLLLEYKALELRSQLVPGSVPQPYLLSDKHSCIVMEDFNAYSSLVSQLRSGQIDESALNKLINVTAQLHNETIGQDKLAQFGEDFMNNTNTERLLKFKFVDAFSNETVAKLTNTSLTGIERVLNDEIKQTVEQLYKMVLDKKQAVIHGNLNAENVVVLNGQIKLLGNHFTIVGPCSLDVATLLAQYLSYYHIHMLTEQDNDSHRQVAYQMVTISETLVSGYLAEMQSVYDKTSGEEFVSNVAGLCGVEMVNWAVNAPNGSDAVAILDSGLRLIGAAHRIHSPGQLVNIALMLTL